MMGETKMTKLSTVVTIRDVYEVFGIIVFESTRITQINGEFPLCACHKPRSLAN